MTVTQQLTIEQAYMVLNGLPGLGAISVQKLLNFFGKNPLNIFKANREDFQNIPYLRSSSIDALLNPFAHFDLIKEESLLNQLGGVFISIANPDYPHLLKHIQDPPTGLYALGPCSLGQKNIAIVGSRRCTLYGLAIAKKLASQLASLGFCIVSGLAKGIDAAAHEGALAVGGSTLAVLGCGVDLIYPPDNQNLYHTIKQKGGIISEFVLGQKGDRYTFPMRNRIISGVSQAVIVIETDEHGGSMITARMAGEQGRHIFAVPGRIDQVSSAGCHALIRDGATLVRNVEDILDELSHLNQTQFKFSEAATLAKGKEITPELPEKEGMLLSILKEAGPCSLDKISELSGLAIAQVSASLLMLELKKLLVKRADGSFEAR